MSIRGFEGKGNMGGASILYVSFRGVRSTNTEPRVIIRKQYPRLILTVSARRTELLCQNTQHRLHSTAI